MYMPTNKNTEKKMIENEHGTSKMNLKTVLTHALGDLIKPDDMAPEARGSLIKDIVEIVTPIIKKSPNSGNLPKDITNALLPEHGENSRGNENLNTEVGRVANFIREKAAAGLIFNTKNDKTIKNTLIDEINTALAKHASAINTALEIEGTAQGLAKVGVEIDDRSFGEKTLDAATQGVKNAVEIGKQIPGAFIPNLNNDKPNRSAKSAPGGGGR